MHSRPKFPKLPVLVYVQYHIQTKIWVYDLFYRPNVGLGLYRLDHFICLWDMSTIIIVSLQHRRKEDCRSLNLRISLRLL